MGPRTGLSAILIVGALVLLVAIAVGNSMGNRVLGQIPERMPALAVTPLPSPSTAEGTDTIGQALWKRRQVLSVATDPAFPDPRVTPEPPVPATPKPTPKPTPSPSPSPTDDSVRSDYTSPPLPIPLDTGPEQTPPAEQAPASPGPRPT
ncbi:MAG: hypothetical protein IAI50_20090 [Candidatus Eremiobacteraeota bacterium]|nr:hypothetical protein [Candidatus Eremiobacteraeota bacterium]